MSERHSPDEPVVRVPASAYQELRLMLVKYGVVSPGAVSHFHLFGTRWEPAHPLPDAKDDTLSIVGAIKTERLQKALAFYADPSNYTDPPGDEDADYPVILDGGETARLALEGKL